MGCLEVFIPSHLWFFFALGDITGSTKKGQASFQGLGFCLTCLVCNSEGPVQTRGRATAGMGQRRLVVPACSSGHRAQAGVGLELDLGHGEESGDGFET